jgi:hypothetical protein
MERDNMEDLSIGWRTLKWKLQRWEIIENWGKVAHDRAHNGITVDMVMNLWVP